MCQQRHRPAISVPTLLCAWFNAPCCLNILTEPPDSIYHLIIGTCRKLLHDKSELIFYMMAVKPADKELWCIICDRMSSLLLARGCVKLIDCGSCRCGRTDVTHWFATVFLRTPVLHLAADSFFFSTTRHCFWRKENDYNKEGLVMQSYPRQTIYQANRSCFISQMNT